MVGIYRIVNKANGKFYIGSSLFCNSRKKTHFSKLRNGYNNNRHLQSAWNKYGENNFEFEVILELPQNISIKRLEKIERYFIDVLRPQYNKTKITKRYGKADRKKPDKETSEIMSKEDFSRLMKRICNTQEHKEKKSELRKKYYNSLTEQQKIEANKYKIGRVFSSSTRKILSEKAKKRKWSPEIKAKISKTLKEKKRRLTDENGGA